MMSEQPLTLLLQQAAAGNREADEALLKHVYGELKQMARSAMRGERSGHTLQPTDLVNEVCLRLLGSRRDFDNRAHFFGTAARAMRQVLVEHARRVRARKRGGDQQRVTFEDLQAAASQPEFDVEALDEALEVLEQENSRVSEVVHLRFFTGLTIEETAALTNASTSRVKRDWTYAKAWLLERLGEGGG